MPSSLNELGLLHGTDKSSRRHDFLDVYERHVSHLRDRPVTVLEIGIYQGASLRMWRDFFVSGLIVGIDIRPDSGKFEEERVKVEIGNAGDPGFLRSVGEKYGPFGVILDDGSHYWRHQQIAFDILWQFLAPSGIFVIEDLHTSYIPRYEGGLGGEPTVKWLRDRIDYVVPGGPEFRAAGLSLTPDLLPWRNEVREITFLRESAIVSKASPPLA